MPPPANAVLWHCPMRAAKGMLGIPNMPYMRPLFPPPCALGVGGGSLRGDSRSNQLTHNDLRNIAKNFHSFFAAIIQLSCRFVKRFCANFSIFFGTFGAHCAFVPRAMPNVSGFLMLRKSLWVSMSMLYRAYINMRHCSPIPISQPQRATSMFEPQGIT